MDTDYKDAELINYGHNERSRTLANLYEDQASRALCLCSRHFDDRPDCPKAIWEQAAHHARMMVDE